MHIVSCYHRGSDKFLALFPDPPSFPLLAVLLATESWAGLYCKQRKAEQGLGTRLTNSKKEYSHVTRRNSLVNQIEFIGLVRTFATVSPSSIQRLTQSKKVGIDFCYKGSCT